MEARAQTPVVLQGDPDVGMKTLEGGLGSSGGGVNVAADGCEKIGDFSTVFSGISLYRGNIYEIERGAELLEYGAELIIPASSVVKIYFSVFKESATPGTYDKILEISRDVPGQGEPAVFVMSGPLGLPPVQAGERYFLSVGWGNQATVFFGRLSATFPKPFSLGSVLGLSGSNSPPPLPQTLTITPSKSGAYSQQLCIRQKGACCDGSSCSEEFEEDCDILGGVFTAPGISCDDVAEAGGCPLREGACCFGDECQTLNRFACENGEGGAYQGHFTTCSQNCPVGACCLPDGSCIDGISESFCTAQGGTYRGDGEVCAGIFPACGTGACCHPDGCIEELTAAFCAQIGGKFRAEGSSCETLDPLCPGFCCWEINTNLNCSDNLSPTDCAELPDSAFGGYGKACRDIPAPCENETYGGCCLPDGRCFFTTEEACMALNGSWKSGKTCAQINCGERACCLPDGSCADMSEYDCRKMGGVVSGPSCAGTSCPEALQGCCWPDESCSEVPASVCMANGGAPLGPGTDCSGAACQEFTACCLPDGSCLITEPGVCSDVLKGQPRPPGTDCQSANCAVELVACCLGNGSCLDVTEAACINQGGQPLGKGTSCATSNCPVPCNQIKKFKGNCGSNGKLTAKFASSLNNYQITALLNGANPVTQVTNGRGKAKFQWTGLIPGTYVIEVKGCPTTRRTVGCP